MLSVTSRRSQTKADAQLDVNQDCCTQKRLSTLFSAYEKISAGSILGANVWSTVRTAIFLLPLFPNVGTFLAPDNRMTARSLPPLALT